MIDGAHPKASRWDAVDDEIRDVITGARPQLVRLSHYIHEHPELAFAEHRAVSAVAEAAERADFDVRVGIAGLPTALTATFGDGDMTVGLCAEYDALPAIGHACGHNMIAASAVGAALGLRAVADRLGVRVKLIGTPAEEHGHGKIRLVEGGVFDDVTVAMMVHPSRNDVHPDAFRTQAVHRFAATYAGRAAHAAAAPQAGVNAADAAVIAQVAIGLLRQQVADASRIGLFVREAGRVTNVIPDRAVVECEVRAFTTDECERLTERITACFRAGALATGATLTLERTEPDCAPLKQDARLGALYARAVARTGRTASTDDQGTRGSTDMGNVSQLVPSIHPMIGIRGSRGASHSPEFARDAISPAADDAVVDGALALAWTASAAAGDARLRRELLAEQARRADA
ncbi:amidohydrolase [Pseudonocardia acaciae]|uniref:amidohydrolase n=1 Tax=Pseudonocardia acaciae TaxID=551276 RepID=UPI0007E8CA79|nr:amidohydrolase [Pseudonocardia acaciae]